MKIELTSKELIEILNELNNNMHQKLISIEHEYNDIHLKNDNNNDDAKQIFINALETMK